ncbi:hypothetical protein GCM10010530_55460 [Kribbella aluminosa]
MPGQAVGKRLSTADFDPPLHGRVFHSRVAGSVTICDHMVRSSTMVFARIFEPVRGVWHGVRCPADPSGHERGAMTTVPKVSRLAGMSQGEGGTARMWGNSMAAGSDGPSGSWSRVSRRTVACRILPATVRVTAV